MATNDKNKTNISLQDMWLLSLFLSPNPVSRLVKGFFFGLWIPVAASLIFCFFTGVNFFFFWKCVFVGGFGVLWDGIHYFSNHMDEVHHFFWHPPQS